MKIRIISLVLSTLCICFTTARCQSHKESNSNTWSVYRGGPKSTSYSPLKQINKTNVKQLQLAWVFKPKDSRQGRRERSETNPIVVNGILYTISGRGRVYAVNAVSGKKVWAFDPFNGGGVKISKVRAVTYWQGGGDQYILFTAGYHLWEVNAKTGKPISEFGRNGKINLKKALRDAPEGVPVEGIVRVTSPGIIYKNLIILGNRGTDKYGDVPNDIRAYNVKTGKLVWTFHVIPRPGEPGYDTWPKGAWKYVGGAGDWAGLSLDQKKGVVFLTTGSASYDFYGGGRAPGKNLYANCVIALDASTGKLIWHFQTVHHNLWDYDLAAPPVLTTVKRHGKKIDAVAAANKNGFLFVLNRKTGKPLFPVVEKKVPASKVPGEKAYPTQPFPLSPKPFANQHMTDSLITDYSPQVHDSLLKVFHSLRYEGLFTPPSIQGTLEMPATIGGVEWGSLAYDPQTHILYVKSNTNEAEIVKLRKYYSSGKSAANKKSAISKALVNKTVYQQGKLFYKKYCSSCHGVNRQGKGLAPSLVGIKKILTRDQVLHQINKGGGNMPAFGQIINTVQKNAIIAYLFNDKKAKAVHPKESGGKSKKKTMRKILDERGRNPHLPMYRNVTAYRHFSDKKGRSAIKPPWGLLSAINLNTGDYEWQIPIGRSEGPMVTGGGVVFLATSGNGKGTGMRGQHQLQAYDKATGKLLWETSIPANSSSTPSTYKLNGRQYVALSVAGTKSNPGGSVMAFALSQ
jgi:quinoprotein glucose dehydrogenase